MSDQDINAANHGDRLKHPINLWLLHRGVREVGAMGVRYAETHAGCGIYQAKSQFVAEIRKKSGLKYACPHIMELRYFHNRACSNHIWRPTSNDPAHSYFECLLDWWNDVDNWDSYPGSAYQSLSTLLESNIAYRDFRMTESGSSEFVRLNNSIERILTDKNVRRFGLREDSYYPNIDWFFELDTNWQLLHLIVDPFAVSNSIEPEAERKKGQLPIDDLRLILEKCLVIAEKDRSVVLHLWAKYDPRSKASEPTQELLGRYRKSAELKRFHYDHYHSVLLGFGTSGRKIVSKVPTGKSWQESWLTSQSKKTLYSLPGLITIQSE